MATDIVDAELKSLRNDRWAKVFAQDKMTSTDNSVDDVGVEENPRDAVNRKATIVVSAVACVVFVAPRMIIVSGSAVLTPAAFYCFIPY